MKKTILLLVFLAAWVVVLPQVTIITGTVTSSDDNQTIPGVAVTAKGTTMGDVTNVDGFYSISVPASVTTLVFQFIGYKPQEVLIDGRSVINVVLEPDIFSVDEVVVVGYGIQKKREVTGSIAQVKGDAIAKLATPSFESQLAGRSAGVQITSQTGVLGETPRFRIRGVGSISSGTYPLIVVDGIPVFTGDLGGYASANSLGDINPADIESIEILKDGSGTAIYGSRAANGVVLITTKRGSKGRMRVDYNTYMGVASPVKFFDLLGTDDFITISNEKRTNSGLSPIAFGTEYDTDWQREVLRANAFQQDHTLAISGGTQLSSYYFSLGYSDQEGVTKPNEMNRFTVRANVDQNVTKWLSIGANVGVTRTSYFGLNTGTNSLSGNIFSAIRQLPNTPIYNEDHPTGYNIDNVATNLVGRWDNAQTIGDNLPNIVYVIDHNRFTSKIMRTIGNAYAQINFMPNLNFRTQVSVDNSSAEGLLYYNPIHGDGASVNGRVHNNYQNALRWNWQNVISYNETLGDHTINVVLVNELQSQRVNSFFAAGTDLSNEFFQYNLISNSYSNHDTGGGLTENGFVSWAGRFNYNYMEKYFLQASFRRDAISSLPEANRYGFFPGGSIGWNIAKESFMDGISGVLTDMKLRASYAQVGNVSIGNYPYAGLYSAATYGPYNGIAFSQAGNSDLRWETSKKYDIGFDAMFYEGKYKLTFDYFKNDQDGLIMDAPTPPSMGIPGNSISQNIGKLVNWGYEFSGEAVLVMNQDFKWSLDANLTLTKNEILELVAGSDIIGTYTIIRENESIRSIYGFDYWGVNPATGNPVYIGGDGRLIEKDVMSGTETSFDPDNPSSTGEPESLSSTNDRIIFGPSLPTYYGAVNTSVEFKGFDLGVMFRFSGGNYIMNATRTDLQNLNFTNNSKEILGRWQSPSNPGDGMVPRLGFQEDFNTFLDGYTMGRFVEKGDFLKIQNIVVGYTLPSTFLNRVGIGSMRVYGQVQDAFMFTKYKGIDPEMESNGVDLNGTPRQRVITFGISMSL